MLYGRRILSIWVAVALAVMPVSSALAAAPMSNVVQSDANHHHDAHGLPADMTGMNADELAAVGEAIPDMADCHKVPGKSGCCDDKSKCFDHATCMTKCCKALGTVSSATKVFSMVAFCYQSVGADKPPGWVSAPPAPPPRA